MKARPSKKNPRARLEAAFAAFQARSRDIYTEAPVCRALQPILRHESGRDTHVGASYPGASDAMPPLL